MEIYLGNRVTGIMVNKGNHPQMALFQVSELLIIITYPDIRIKYDKIL